jgi:DNA-binding YbaB/EbfC family protein
MSFNPNNMQKMLKQMQKMQADVARVQEELKSATVEVQAGGVIKAVFNGHGEIQSVSVDPAILEAQDVEMLQDLIVAVVREGQAKAQQLAEERLGQVTGQLKIPGMPGLF